MKKAFVCLAGLATVLLSQPTFAASPTWNSGFKSAGSPSLAQHRESRPFMAAGPDRLPIPSGASEAPIGVADQAADPHTSPAALPPPPHLADADLQEPVSPLPPNPPALDPPSSEPSFAGATAGATPIPSQLGVEFDMSNSTQPLPPPVQPLIPNQIDQPNTTTIPPQPIQPSAQPSPANTSKIPAKILTEVPLPPSQPSPSLSLSPTPTPTPSLSPLPLLPPAPQTAAKNSFTLSDLFQGNSDSIVAVIVGNAEGTRSPDGTPNPAFYGHTDPGNGVWNLGTFSYQHGASSPEEADAKQLERLQKQAKVMQDKASAKGLKLTLEEALNGIDLANQAPQAVLDVEGYIDRLAQAHQQGLQGSDAILWARVQSFINPQTQQWDAPGLGNTEAKIRHDQQRRQQAIAKAIQTQDYAIASEARLKPIGFRLPRIVSMVRRFSAQTAHFLGFS